MPGPGVTVLAVVGTVAVGYAFYQFVYEPHIAPKLEQWAETFVASRKAQRLQKQGLVAVPQYPESKGKMSATKRTPSSDDESDDDADWNKQGSGRRSSIELENLVAKELREWRSEVSSDNLRHRKATSTRTPPINVNTLDESNVFIPYSTISPTHVIFDPSDPCTPTSTIGSSAGKRLPELLVHKLSHSTLRTADGAESPPNSHEFASRSYEPGPWVAQQRDLAKRFQTAGTDFPSDDDESNIDAFSRSSTPFAASRDTGSLRTPSSNSSSRAASPMYQTALSPFMSPTSPQINLPAPIPPSSSSPSTPLVFSPEIPSLSFTAHASSDEGYPISRPESSMSLNYDAESTGSTPSELSFTPSEKFSDLDDLDEDGVISVGSNSDIASEGRGT